MPLDVKKQKQERRPVGLGILGLLLLGASVYLSLVLFQQPSNIDAVEVEGDAKYVVNQSVKASVTYVQNSFFEDGPGLTNTAYVNELTDTILSTFRYNFSASKASDITYTYDIRSVVRGGYALKDEEGNTSDVWSRNFQLVAPVTAKTTSAFAVNPSVEIPYAEYKRMLEQFKNTLSIPLTSEVITTFTMRVAGTIGGEPISDTQVATVTAPLDQQVYQVAVKYNKSETKQVSPADKKSSWNPKEHIDVIALTATAILGFIITFYGFRRQIFKTPYQRELDRIYRYHDGIIIRARKPADLAGKNLVPVQGFDDMLNLEEELKVPIVATAMGSEATRFMIIHGDNVYAYTLGKALIDEDSFAEMEHSLPDEHASHSKKTSTKNTRINIQDINR